MIRVLFITFLSLSCGKVKTSENVIYETHKLKMTAYGWKAQLQSIELDALGFTKGSIQLAMPKTGLTQKKVLVLPESGDLNAERMGILLPFCTDLEIDLKNSGGRLTWRSRYDLDAVEALESSELATWDFSCGFLLSESEAGEHYLLRIDPFPKPGREDYFGVSELDKALELSVPLPFSEPLEYPRIAFIEADSNLPTAKAIDPQLINLIVEKFPDYQCDTVDFEGSADLKNVGHVLWTEIKIDNQEVRISDVRLSQTSALFPYCQSIALRTHESRIAMGMSCAAHEQMIADHYCQYLVEVENIADPKDSLFIPYTFPKPVARVLSGSSVDGAAALVPPSSENPTQSARLEIDLDLPLTMRRGLEKSFDLWAYIDSNSMNGLVKDLKKISNGKQEICQAGVRAYVDSAMPGRIFICEAYFSVSLNYVSLGLTMFHELLHIQGKQHDRDNASYASCTVEGGTTYAAKFAVNVYECQAKFCLGFRTLARQEFLAEMYYSLGSDSRLYSTACGEWASKVGVVF
jgi:hypothetical protein